MRYQVDFFASIEATKYIKLFWVMRESALGQSVCRIFYFDLFDFLILITGVHCNIVLVQKDSVTPVHGESNLRERVVSDDSYLSF